MLPTLNSEELNMYSAGFCVFEYLYRDAANYKLHEAILLSGDFLPSDGERIVAALLDRLYFIPEAIGLDSLQQGFSSYSETPSEDDHVWHEFRALRPAEQDDLYRLICRGEKDALIAAITSVPAWEERSSPMYATLSGAC